MRNNGGSDIEPNTIQAKIDIIRLLELSVVHWLYRSNFRLGAEPRRPGSEATPVT